MRFKPIGGMFQGVRGSTAVSSGENDAKKLVMLDENGEIDDSCLNPGLREAGSLRTDLDNEVFDRRQGDNELLHGLEDLDQKIDERTVSLGNLIATLSGTVDANKREADDGLSAANSRIDDNSGDISSQGDAISSMTGDIAAIRADLEDQAREISNLRNEVSEETSRVDGAEREILTMSESLERNNRLLESVSASLASVGNTLLDITTRLVTDEQAIKTVQEYVVTKMNAIQAVQQTFDDRLSEIEDILRDKLEENSAFEGGQGG